MKRYLTPITLAAALVVLAIGAAGGAVAASAASSPGQPNAAQMRAKCEQRAGLRVKLRDAFKAERQKENVLRLDPSKRQELAHEFLNYLLRPAVASTIASEMRCATCNAAARELLPEPEQQNPVLYPPSSVLARGEWFRPLPAAVQRLRDRYWTEIKSA